MAQSIRYSTIAPIFPEPKRCGGQHNDIILLRQGVQIIYQGFHNLKTKAELMLVHITQYFVGCGLNFLGPQGHHILKGWASFCSLFRQYLSFIILLENWSSLISIHFSSSHGTSVPRLHFSALVKQYIFVSFFYHVLKFELIVVYAM